MSFFLQEEKNMNSTALGAENTKKQEIVFINEAHWSYVKKKYKLNVNFFLNIQHTINIKSASIFPFKPYTHFSCFYIYGFC